VVEMIAQRYYVTPPTAAEMAKALQDEPDSDTAVDDSALQNGPAPVQGSQQGVSTQMAQGQNPVADAEERSCVIGCCGIYLVLGGRRPQ